MATLLDKLKAYSAKGIVPLHMPGHKRNNTLSQDLPYQLDITEITGFDNLHCCSGVLADLADKCAAIYGSDHAFPLINGSTCGTLAATRAATKPGDKVIVARNCHRSVYHALELNQLQAIFIQPDLDPVFGIAGSIDPQQLAATLKHDSDVSLVIITSPTYEGIASDIRQLADIAHQYKTPLFIDAAHGAHLGFSDFFPPSPVSLGADLVVMSLHKTLPSLTQTALLHLKSDLIAAEDISRELAVFESSSPSYILLASIDQCISLLDDQHQQLFAAFEKNLGCLTKELADLKRLTYLGEADNHSPFFALDPSKIIVSTRKTNLSGADLAAQLRNDWQIEIEMSAADYIIAITSIFDSKKNLSRFSRALRQIDKQLLTDPQTNHDKHHSLPPLPETSITLAQARESRGVEIPLDKAAGRVSLQYILAYPPAVPLIIPGEIISEEMISYIQVLIDNGVDIYADNQSSQYKIKVTAE